MPTTNPFKQSVISHHVKRVLYRNAMNKYLYLSLLFGVVISPSLYAQQTASLDTKTASEHIDLKPITSQAVADNLGHTSAEIHDTLNPDRTLTNDDSVTLLEQQSQPDRKTDLFKPIEFEDLENIAIDPVDPQLAAEILQTAEDAKQQAEIMEQSNLGRIDFAVKDSSVEEINEISRSPVNVDQLMGSIQSDSKIVVNALQNDQVDSKALNDLGLTQPIQAADEKPGLFKRISQRFRPQKDSAVQVPKISTVVEGAPTELANNIKAKLSTFSVESFSDYSSAVPQLRVLSNQAAQALGYYDASFKFEKVNAQRVKVKVVPGETVKVKSLEVEYSGAGMRLPQFQLIRVLPDLSIDDPLNHAQYELTKSRIVEAAANNGFFDSFWRLHDVKVNLPENTADINLRFETGDRYKLGEVEFRMSDPSKPLPIDLKILKTLAPWKEGADYTAWRVNGLANNLTNSRYFNYTLVDAVKPDPVVEPLELAPDLQALVEQEKITESELLASQTDQSIIARRSQGEDVVVKSQNVVDEQQFAGANTEQRALYAHETEQQTDKENEQERLKQQAREDKVVPVIVTLNADRLNSLETGIGYGTDTGVRARAQYRRAIVNQKGHSFDANLELSQIRQSIDGRYNMPYNHPLNDYISVVGGYEREDRDGVGPGMNLVIESAVAGVDRIIKGSRNDWQHVFGLRYRLDRLTQQGIVENIPDQFLIPGSEPEQKALLVGYEVSKITSNNRINPTQGFKQSYKLELGSKSAFSNTDIAILNANWKFLYSMGENSDHQILAGTNLGYIFTPEFEKVPYNLRYFAGGDQSMRGFDYKSLSPVEYGYKIGGQGLAIGTLEYNYQFKDGWRAAVFSDFGNAYDEKFSNKTEYSVGMGIRWRSPIGPIRLDVASGISNEGKPIRLHFFIGSQL